MRFTAVGFGIEVTTDVAPGLDVLDVPGWFPPGFTMEPNRERAVTFRIYGRPDDIWIAGDEGDLTRVPTEDDARINFLLCLAPLIDGGAVNLFHAGAVSTPHGALVFAGVSGSGKSRLTKVLAEGGCGYLSDEIAAVTRAGVVHPWPKPLSIRYDEDLSPGLYDPRDLGLEVVPHPVPIAAILLLRFEPGAELLVEEVPAARAVLELLPHSFSPRDARLLPQLRALCQRVPVLAGCRGDARHAADDLMDLAERYAGYRR